MKTLLDKIDGCIEEEKEVTIETESEVLTGIIQSRGEDYIEFKKDEIIYIFPIVRIMSLSIGKTTYDKSTTD